MNEEGIQPWLDEENLLPGQDWAREIPKAVRASDVVIVCISQSSRNKAGYLQNEIEHALDVADEQPEGTIFLIPLRLEECMVPDRLSQWQWVDYFADQGYERLMRSLRARANSLGSLRLDDKIRDPTPDVRKLLSGKITRRGLLSVAVVSSGGLGIVALAQYLTQTTTVEPPGTLAPAVSPAPSAPAVKQNVPTAPALASPGSVSPAASPGPVGQRSFTPQEIATIVGAPLANVTATWPHLEAALTARGIGDRPVQIAAIATVAVETGSFAPIQELASGDEYEGRADLGNTQPGDGHRYKGRGFMRITGRANYRTYGNLLSVDLVGNPDLALDPNIASQIVAVYFTDHLIRWQPAPAPLMSCADLARAGEWRGVRIAITGGTNGLERFLQIVSALAALSREAGPASVDLIMDRRDVYVIRLPDGQVVQIQKTPQAVGSPSPQPANSASP